MGDKKIIWKINGMHCMSCANLVKEELSELLGVKNVEVLLESGEAVITFKEEDKEPDKKEAGKKLAELGFTIE